MKRRLLCLLLALCIVIGLVGCGGGEEASPAPTGTETQQPEQNGQLTLPVYSGDTLHPALGGNRTNVTLAPLLYEGLFTLDASFTPQRCLCRSYTCSEDGLVWRFVVHTDARWSDGTDLTAGDVAEALNTARGSGSRYAARLSAVAGVAAEGTDTVVVTLKSPNGNLPALLDIPLAKGTDKKPAGTGPYRLTEGEAGWVLTLRTDWWQVDQKTFAARDIALFDVSAADDLLYAFDTREIDLVVTDFTGSDTLGYSSDYAVWEYDTANLIYLGFRATEGSPCADAAVRRAISNAIDRTALTSGVFAHHARASALPVSPASPLYDAAIAPVEGDGGAALTALSDTLSGKELTLLVSNANPFKVTAAGRIAETLRSCGVAVRVEALDYEAYTAALNRGGYDLYLAEVAMAPDFDPTLLVGTGGALNYGGYGSTTTDALLAGLRRADETGRTTAAAALYRELAEQAPLAPLCFKTGSVLTQWGSMKGLTPTAGNVFYQMENWTF